MPLVQTRGAASAQGFGEFAQATAVNYIEDVFSTYLYTGTGAALTITNNIDLSTKGGLVWIKGRSGATGHRLTDTARGATKSLASETTAAEATETTGLTAFGTTGFTIGADADYNTSAATYVSWTFREQAKFFDVVTYTGNASSRTIAHNLGSVPGCIIVKCTSNTDNWYVYHRSLAATENVRLNQTNAVSTNNYFWDSTAPTSTVFSVGASGNTNQNGDTYVAYLFAHDAGGFGLAGTDNVISCGSLTGSGAGIATTVTLGYEPQFILAKVTGAAQNWVMFDNMRGFDNTNAARLFPNLTNVESTVPAANYFTPTATGFTYGPGNSMGDTANIIYIAIRRGPMKVPTLGTSVFAPIARTGTGAAATVSGVGFPTDLVFHRARLDNVVTPANMWQDRLRGIQQYLKSNNTNQEFTDTAGILTLTMDGMTVGTDSSESNVNESTATYINYFFRRSPSFFDEVCYTGTGSNTTQTHNLGVVPELIIVKRRDTTDAWDSYSSALANTEYVVLNTTAAKATGATRWNSTTPTSSVFSVGTSTTTNASAGTYAAYLFATCAGVSKVFSYTGNGSSQTINCGFTGGARFVLIKRTDSTGDWYVWDSARGIVAGNDPHLSLNTTAAEVTTDDSVDTDSTGFIVNQVAATNVNVSSATYIGLAVA